MVVVIDAAKGPNGDHGGTVAAPIFRNIAEPALRYLGIPWSINPPPPVLVARHDGTDHTPTSGQASEPIVSLVADGPPGTVPDLRGMSAREALRKLVKVGLNAHVSGDGFVVSQEPAPGSPIDGEAVCRLVLERWPSRRAGTTGRP
jgi:cell division protein FtsI (penicillin-binding protein 3)